MLLNKGSGHVGLSFDGYSVALHETAGESLWGADIPHELRVGQVLCRDQATLHAKRRYETEQFPNRKTERIVSAGFTLPRHEQEVEEAAALCHPPVQEHDFRRHGR